MKSEIFFFINLWIHDTMIIGDGMKSIYKTNIHGRLEQLQEYTENNWVHLLKPTEEEIDEVSSSFHVSKKLMMKLLDDAELPRIEKRGKDLLIVIDVPYIVNTKKRKKYRVMPLGIILSKGVIITISNLDHPLLKDAKEGHIRHLSTLDQHSFPIQLIGKSADYYLKYLTEVYEDIRGKEQVLVRSTNNKELVHMLTLEKSLVYFITSLKANDVVLEKLATGSILTLSDVEKEWLNDARIENKQGLEMANMYREILDSTMDTYGTIISNNLNDVMKFLTSITLVISIPTMIASFMGMNVPLGRLAFDPSAFFFIIGVSVILSIIIVILLRKKDLL